jgi:hypothetical protein
VNAWRKKSVGLLGGRVGERVQRDEIMDRAEIARRSDRHAGADQLPGAGLALVTQPVVLV